MSYKERQASKKSLKPPSFPQRRRVTAIPITPSSSMKALRVDECSRKQRSHTLPMAEESHMQSRVLKQSFTLTCGTAMPIPHKLIKEKEVELPRPVGYEGKKTLILDLDETLVHCVQDLNKNPEVFLNIKFPDGNTRKTGFNLRPFLKETLATLSLIYEVVVFTASRQFYADAILDYLDPSKSLFHHRLYRQHCINMGGYLFKDLRILAGRNVSDIVIVDNMPSSFANQIDNGIAIISWFDNYSDTELDKLTDYLKMIVDVPDVRDVNRNTFRLRYKRRDTCKISMYIPKHLAF